ncbi:MAG: TetR/AcrR family transcriptional regulator [Campylobacterota bacterium]|nr:TetR/AcrR family transcriptional regulator [Campylobacterota bacterium]
MAIIVDKLQKRKDIALSCTELLLKKGIKKTTVAELAKTAGIAKGSIYDYFENKEDIIFEVIRNEIYSYQKELNENIKECYSVREKVFELFDFLLVDNEWNKRHRNFYKEYISIDLGSENIYMSKFNLECNNFFKDILTVFIEDGISKNELIKDSLNFVDTLIAIQKGFLIISWTEKRDIKKELIESLNTIFDLVEVRK